MKEAIHIEKALGSNAIAPSLCEMAKKVETKDDWSRAANGASTNRIFARTKKGYYVLGPKVIREGDVVCVLSLVEKCLLFYDRGVLFLASWRVLRAWADERGGNRLARSERSYSSRI